MWNIIKAISVFWIAISVGDMVRNGFDLPSHLVFPFMVLILGVIFDFYIWARDDDEQKRYLVHHIAFPRGDFVSKYFSDHNMDEIDQREFIESSVKDKVREISKSEKTGEK